MTVLVNGFIDPAPWLTYVPTITSGTGTITTSSATGKYKQIGKMLYFQVVVTITTNGTGGTNIGFSLPNGLLSTAVFIGSGRASSAAPLEIVSGISSNVVTILTIASAYPGADGVVLWGTGFVETT